MALAGRPVEVEFVSNLYREDERRVIQCNIRDITERTRAEERLARLAHYDSLTGLANRSRLKDELAHAIAVAHRQRRRLAVMFIDLDRFKNSNDTLEAEAFVALSWAERPKPPPLRGSTTAPARAEKSH